jgi:hypothetical protein
MEIQQHALLLTNLMVFVVPNSITLGLTKLRHGVKHLTLLA